MAPQEMERYIAECTNCHKICVETIAYGLQIGGKHAEAKHIRIMLDCAEICQTSADFMLRGSELSASTCALCAEVCEACARSCEQFSTDEQMKRCSEACHRCAESCREMSRMGRKVA